MIVTNEGFNERIKKLFHEGETQEQFAQRVGLNRNTVAKYKNTEKRTAPDAGVIISICQACNVSADWLLGLSEVMSPDPTLQAACAYTGLSEDAVESVRDKVNHSRKFKFGLEYLLTSDPMRVLLMMDTITVISETKQSFEYMKSHFDEVYSDKTPEQKNHFKVLLYVDSEYEDGSIRLAMANAPAYYQKQAEKYFHEITEKLLKDGES